MYKQLNFYGGQLRFPRDKSFLDYLKQVLLDAFEAFLHSSIFDKAVFCLGEKQGMLVYYECSSWYNRVGDFLLVVWDGRKKFYMVMDQYARSVRPTPLQSVRSNGTECYSS